ncbi:ATP-binding cassette domain-containing protein [Pseudonocardia acidicola]|uniref:Sugar ABC transporter ATP-binding protein n=1 Tax=Pseudonocardia acidicola TaxID=2724939 RepID=A0ABX1SB42_9PSEU|nr:ATP-binding cassette domain-containing protein [Pseudonocardia acidicola]NMH97393.1 sugar ABC transporter ATP-binding protein [Pseudonocardia acidicola]
MTEPLLSFASVSKTYGAVRALDDASFSISAGEVVALVGDNGAGKSTLVKVMSGTVVPDTAEIIFEGRPVRIQHPNDAAQLGIATVYQDLALCNNLDVVANLFLGHERSKLSLIDELEMERETADLLAELAITPRSLRVPIGGLSGGQRQTVAIARCLLGKPKVIILDEPTAALGLAQKQQVIDLIRRLQARGLAVILISHNLAEVFAVADRIEVLRLGRNVASFPGDPRHQDEVVAAITGAGVAISEAAQ